MIDPLSQYQDQDQYDLWGQQPVKPATQQPIAQAPVAQQPAPITQGPLDIGQRAPQVRPDPVQTPAAPTAPAYSTDLANTLALYANKLGYTGNARNIQQVESQGESGNETRTEFTDASDEFKNWLQQNPGYQVKRDRDYEYVLDPNGNVINQQQIDRGHTGFLDKLAAAMPALIVGLGTGGLGALASGALAGAAAPAIKGFTEGQNLGDALKGIAKGAAIGGLGGAAAGYINPAAAEFGKAVGGGNEFITKLATDAASGAGRGFVGSALTGGKNLGESVLMGAAGSAAGGAANAAMGEAAGAAGIPPEVMRVLGPTGMAALTGKDWRLAGLTSLIGSLGQDAAQQAALEKQAYESKTDTGDELDRLLRRYPAPDEQADFTQHWYPNEGNLEEDFVVVPGGVRSTYTGETGTFDANGKFVPNYTAPTQTTSTTTTKSPGGTSTKPATGTAPTTATKPTTPSSSTGGMDVNSLMALLALMGGGEQQAAAPVQPLFRRDLDVEKIFGERWFT